MGKDRKSPASGSRSGRGAAVEIAVLGAILVVSLALGYAHEAAGAPPRSWSQPALSAGWLLGASLWWHRRRPLSIAMTQGGHRPWLGAGLGVLGLAGLIAVGQSWTAAARPAAPPWSFLCFVMLLVPVAEELFFRGLLLEHLARHMGRVVAVVLVSALFGLLHHPQDLALPMALLSAVLCAAALHSGSVLWPMVLHLEWNATTMIRTLPTGSERTLVTVGAAVIAFAAIGWGLRSASPPDGDGAEPM